jgi:hypothetical protein
MRKMILLAGMILFAAAISRAQETPGAELSASYSYLRLGISNGVNQNGASISAADNLNRWFGLANDFGGHQKSEAGVTFNTYTCLGGPRFSYRKCSRVTPFAQVAQALVGGARGSLAGSGSGNRFADSADGRVDCGCGFGNR